MVDLHRITSRARSPEVLRGATPAAGPPAPSAGNSRGDFFVPETPSHSLLKTSRESTLDPHLIDPSLPMDPDFPFPRASTSRVNVAQLGQLVDEAGNN